MPATKKEPNPVDQEIGLRIRSRRLQLKMSQQKLGEHLGITFQQIQKYEKGTNRVGGSRLRQIAKVLDCPASYLLGGADDSGDPVPQEFMQMMGTRDGQRMMVAFAKMPEGVRQHFVRLCEAICEPNNAATA